MSKPLIIFGSSRKNGNTGIIINEVFQGEEYDLVNLNDLNIGYYQYTDKTQQDDFIDQILKMQRTETIIFATPIYWYSMSAQMKTFFDRFSDLINVRKDLGQSLKSKRVFLITSSSQNYLPQGFEMPFKGIADYFGMVYKGSLHSWSKDGKIPEVLKDSIQKFRNKIFKHLNNTSHSLAKQNKRMV